MTIIMTIPLEPTGQSPTEGGGRSLIEFRRIYDDDGKCILFDIYLDGNWVGSRRTIKQCFEVRDNYRREEIT